ncbi:hypothetical protein [Kitasatospora sp. NPDC094011]|uniref:hypothetical protein n=1 Tax=Kitasatospora sp. NPDC094011 TaxID=3364090 RepID=UPI00380B3EFB
MTMVPPDDPYSLATFLGAVDPLTDALRQQEAVTALSGLSRALHRAAEQEVAGVVHGFLGLDMIDLVAAGWRDYAGLAAAARNTCAAPDSEELVALVDHRVTSVHHPTVKVLVDGEPVGTLVVTIEVVFELEGIVVVVRRGRIVAVRAGYCTARATLAVEQIPVASRQRRFDLPGGVRWRRGVQLRPCPRPPDRGGP